MSEPRLPAAAAGEFFLAKVVLFTSGVGYFQREGAVTGNAGTGLFFKTAYINDLLKSLVIQDLDGGLVTGVTQASRGPLTRTLQSFAVDLTGNPNLAGVQKLRFLTPSLQEELDPALALLAENRSAEKKRVALGFSGKGTRRVRVGYLMEAPLWKTSYRLVREENEHYLQGWAIG